MATSVGETRLKLNPKTIENTRVTMNTIIPLHTFASSAVAIVEWGILNCQKRNIRPRNKKEKRKKIRVRNLFAWNFFGTGTLVKYPFRNYNQSSSSKIVKDHYVWFLAPWFQKGSKKVPKRFQNSSKKVPNICSINVLPI